VRSLPRRGVTPGLPWGSRPGPLHIDAGSSHCAHPAQQTVLHDYIHAVEDTASRRDRLTRQTKRAYFFNSLLVRNLLFLKRRLLSEFGGLLVARIDKIIQRSRLTILLRFIRRLSVAFRFEQAADLLLSSFPMASAR
jgi:hypothetical protein